MLSAIVEEHGFVLLDFWFSLSKLFWLEGEIMF
jgi:hypothetical protein